MALVIFLNRYSMKLHKKSRIKPHFSMICGQEMIKSLFSLKIRLRSIGGAVSSQNQNKCTFAMKYKLNNSFFCF